MKYSKENLEKQYESGDKLKYLLFWGHKKSLSGEVTSSCFSQWWIQKFKINDIYYNTSEQYMMAEKARLFNDKDAELGILESASPGEAKKIGREVKNFKQSIWEKHRIKIVIKGNFHKFKDNPELATYLLNTKSRILVEASPVDTIWGIGLDKKSESAKKPNEWRGLNLLGFALMEVRDLISQRK